MNRPDNLLNGKRNLFSCVFSSFALVLIFVIIILLNRFTPMALDDYAYSFDSGSGAPITSLSQIIPSMKVEYNVGNGRLLTHGLVQAGMLISPAAFDVLNSLLFTVLIFLVCYHARGSIKKINGVCILFSFVFIWLFSPNFAQPFLWHDGSMNYMLPAVLLMLSLIPYRRFFREYTRLSVTKNILLTVYALLSGFLTGYSNESVSTVFIILQVLFAAAYVIRKYKLRIWMPFFLIGNVTGLSLMLSSPTYGSRSQIWGENTFSGILLGAVKRVPSAVFLTVRSLLFPILIFLAAFVLLCIFSGKKGLRNLTSEQTDNIFLVLIFAVSAAAFGMLSCVCDYFPDRIWVPAVLFLFISVSLSVTFFPVKEKYFSIAVCAAAVCTVCFSCIPVIKNAAVLYDEYSVREEYIKEEKAKGNYDLELSPVYGGSKYSVFLKSGDISDDPDMIWVKKTFIKYHGLKSVTIKSRSDNG